MTRRTLVAILTIVAATILLAAHAWLWFSVIFLLDITTEAIQIILAVLFGLFAVGFLPSMYLVHIRENWLTSWVYTVVATWLGLALYLAIACSVGLLIVWLLPLAAWREWIGIVAVGGALGYAGYGVWNAQFPRVRRVSLPADRFPESWRGKTIVQLSDVHLGVVHHIKFMRRVVTLTKALHPDIIFITGDLYDGVGQELGLMANPLQELRPPMGMYFITGNHETYVGVEKVFAALKELPMRVLHDEIVDVAGVQVMGVEYHLPGKEKDLGSIIDRLDPSRPSIVLLHEPVPDAVARAADRGASLMLCGHTHKGQLWPFAAITQKIYGRFHYRRSTIKQMTLYTSPGVGTWGPPMRTGNFPEIVALRIG
ncbi:MAG: metallophosphoesterase [Patescibacteria group bacterium]